jgi:hypothetical protein
LEGRSLLSPRHCYHSLEKINNVKQIYYSLYFSSILLRNIALKSFWM